MRQRICLGRGSAWLCLRRPRLSGRLSDDCCDRLGCRGLESEPSTAPRDPTTGGPHAGRLGAYGSELFKVAMEAGRAVGWRRLIPIALLGSLAAHQIQELRPERMHDGTT